MGTGSKLVALAAAMLLILSGWCCVQGDGPAAPPTAGSLAAAAAAVATGTDAGARTPAMPEREDEAPTRSATAGATAGAAADVVRLRGRAVAAEDGLPLAGCRVRATAGGTEVEQATGADGRFDVAVAGTAARVAVSMPGRGLAVWASDAGSPLQSEDLGDFELRRAVVLRGRVVDEHDRPVPDYTILVWDVPEGRRAGDGQKTVVSARCDASGAFAFDRELPAGTWALVGWDSRRRLQSPRTARIDPPCEPPPLLVRTTLVPCIEGVVVDDQGTPVPGVCVARAGFDDGARTDDAGRFSIQAGEGDPPAVRLAVLDPGAFDAPPPTGETTWGTTGVRIQLLRSRELQLHVVDDAGRPVEDFGVVCRPIAAASVDAMRFVRGRGHHAEGRAVVDRVRRGEGWLRVVPASPALSPSAVLSLTVGDAAPAPVQVVLPRRNERAVRVVDAGASPVAGATVTLVRSDACGTTGAAGPIDPRTYPIVSMPDQPWQEIVARATTDAEGTCRLWVDRDGGALALTVECAGHAPRRVRDPVLRAGGEPLTVQLPDAGRIGGRVELGRSDRQTVRVRCRPVGEGEACWVDLQPDGVFLSPLLPVGEYRVTITEQVLFERQGSTAMQCMPVPELEQRVRVTTGAPARLTFTAPARRMATLRGRVLLDGAVPEGLRVDLVLQRDGAEPVRRGEFVPAADGTFVAADLLPGRWRIGVRLVAAGHIDLPAVQPEVVDLAEGEVAERSVAVMRRRLVVHLRDVDGRDLRGRVLVREDGWTAWIDTADGTLVFDPAPPGPIRFAGGAERGDEPPPAAWSAPVQMPQDRSEAMVAVTVPPSGS